MLSTIPRYSCWLYFLSAFEQYWFPAVNMFTQPCIRVCAFCNGCTVMLLIVLWTFLGMCDLLGSALLAFGQFSPSALGNIGYLTVIVSTQAI